MGSDIDRSPQNSAEDIRKAIYTTNAIESLNSVIRKAIKKRKLFPSDDSARKVVYLAIIDASKKWTVPIRNWQAALNRFMFEFEERLADFVSIWQLHRNQDRLAGSSTTTGTIRNIKASVLKSFGAFFGVSLSPAT